MPAHKFRCNHECALRSDEVVHSLLYIQYRKNTQNADEDKVELLDEKILGWGLRCTEKLEIVMGDDALDWDVGGYFLGGLEHLQEDQGLRQCVC